MPPKKTATLNLRIEPGIKDAVQQAALLDNRSVANLVEFTSTGSVVASTLKGAVKTWSSIDTAAKWIRSLGIGTAQINIANWMPGQKSLSL
ncbi:hypothetical protein D5125_10575 [Magnetovirga frankeli]|uniref:hypothetical protein n=1 Tax=Magnetovirga frankeli TaxID=947516 RepID=UPI001292EE58|nr:hypothetical protein D5125_10575 [gamma proteobacterium SS-5]